MKGIILAGGLGTRLLPCTKVTNKHLLPIYDKPMIYYPLLTLRNAGIKETMIVSGKGHAGHFLELLGYGSAFGVRLSYAVQEEPGGIAQALGLAEDFADNGKIVVILGDNIIEDDIAPYIKNFQEQASGAKLFLKPVPDPKRFGIAQVEDGKIIDIEEKPQNPKSDLAVVGLYMYDNNVFKIIKTLKPSQRGELEITDVNNFYIKERSATHDVLKGFWIDAGEFGALLKASNFMERKLNKL